MTDKLEIENQQHLDLKKQLERVNWPITFGTVTIQLRNGRLAIFRVEQTIKCD